MKKHIAKLMTLILLTAAATSEAAPYYRFWRGYKLERLSSVEFQNGLNKGFLAQTVKVGQGRGLLGYVPVLLNPAVSSLNMPHEIALIIYKDEASYKFIRNTPEGQAYGEAHWQWFDKDKGSKSLVPEVYSGKVETEHAYDLLQSNENWQRGTAYYSVSKIKGDLRGYLATMKNEFSKRGLMSYVVLVQNGLLYEYQLWRDQNTLRQELPEVKRLASSSLILSPAFAGETAKQDARFPVIKYGLGINTIFN